MDRSQTQFLELLRAGLWGIAANPDDFKPGSVDWRAVLRIAKEQTMAVVVADGIEALPQELWPPKEVMMKLMMLRVKTGQMHALLNSTIAQIVQALDAEGVPSVVLKGQGIAQNYRRPESRTCGDIDLYTGLGGYEKAYQIIEGLHEGRQHKEAAECEHHLHTDLNGVEVEIHRKTSFFHVFLVISFHKVPPCISMNHWFNHAKAFYPTYIFFYSNLSHIFLHLRN